MTDEDNYRKYRGKCKQMSEEAVAKDPTLTLVRGHYICWSLGKQEHWWTTRKDGSIFDPTVGQFPEPHIGDYIPFDGLTNCEQCGKRIHEDEMQMAGNYPVCSGRCHAKLIGLEEWYTGD